MADARHLVGYTLKQPEVDSVLRPPDLDGYVGQALQADL